jgi:hypothetical protein
MDGSRGISHQRCARAGLNALGIVAVSAEIGLKQRIFQGWVVSGDLDPGLFKAGHSLVRECADKGTHLAADALFLKETQFH